MNGVCLISGGAARAVLHAAQSYFRLPWGQGLHCAHMFFRFPWGQRLRASPMKHSL